MLREEFRNSVRYKPPACTACFLSFYLKLRSLSFQVILPFAPHSNPNPSFVFALIFPEMENEQKWILWEWRGGGGGALSFFSLSFIQETHQDVLLILLQGFFFFNSFPFICTSPFNVSLQRGEYRACPWSLAWITMSLSPFLSPHHQTTAAFLIFVKSSSKGIFSVSMI